MTQEEMMTILRADTELMRAAVVAIDELRGRIAMLTEANNLLVKRNIVLSERVQELGGYSD